MPRVLIAELICSDEDCAVRVEAVVESLDDLEALVCEGCECTLQTLSISEAEPAKLEWPVVLLRELPRAA